MTSDFNFSVSRKRVFSLRMQNLQTHTPYSEIRGLVMLCQYLFIPIKLLAPDGFSVRYLPLVLALIFYSLLLVPIINCSFYHTKIRRESSQI